MPTHNLALATLMAIFFVYLGHAKGAARTCYFGPPPEAYPTNPEKRHWMEQVMQEIRQHCPERPPSVPDPCSSEPCQNGATCYPTAQGVSFSCTCTALFVGEDCSIGVSCQAYVEAGYTSDGETNLYYIEPQCDPSPGRVRARCYLDANRGGWMQLYRASHRTVYACSSSFGFSGTKEDICPGPGNQITGFAVTESGSSLTSGSGWILDGESCESITITNIDLLVDVAGCGDQGDSDWSWGSGGEVIHGVCSTDSDLLKDFDQGGNSPNVQVEISISLGSEGFGTYTMSCHNGGRWIDVDTWPSGSTWRYVFIKP